MTTKSKNMRFDTLETERKRLDKRLKEIRRQEASLLKVRDEGIGRKLRKALRITNPDDADSLWLALDGKKLQQALLVAYSKAKLSPETSNEVPEEANPTKDLPREEPESKPSTFVDFMNGMEDELINEGENVEEDDDE